MLFFDRLSIGRKLALLVIWPMLILTIMAAVGLVTSRQMRREVESVTVYMGAVRTATVADMHHDAVRAAAFRAIIAAERNQAAEGEAARAELQEFEKGLKGSLTELASLPMEPTILKALDDVRPLVDAYLTQASEISAKARGGRRNEAISATPDFQASFEELAGRLSKIGDLIEAGSATVQQETLKRLTSVVGIAIGAPLIGIFFSLMLGRWASNAITAPLRDMTAAATQIAQGNLRVQLSSRSNDESGVLADAFTNMVQYLRDLAGAVDRISGGDLTVQVVPRSPDDALANSLKAMVERLRNTNGRIQEGTHLLGGSISNIAAATTELAASVAQTSAAVVQTASAVEEVKEIALAAGKKAREVSEAANETAAVSRAGEQAVEAAITGMSRIREEMDSISESVGRLGQQTGTIGEITNSVSELAEQSNLLAINAAIEAAKAGEQGKGFGVVAREVRTLANQSKAATAQIRSILSEIQQATSAAIQATENGRRSVESGTRQTRDAGQTIRELARGISASADAVTQISVSSQQQAIGMEQVGSAIDSIRGASNQNASGMRQIEGAAADLKSLSQTLKALVSEFRL